MNKHRVLSFKYAIEGISTALKEEPNLKFHFLAAFLALILGWFLQITKFEFIIILLLTGLVISIELTNTAIETIVDNFTTDHHPGAKKAKDIAAGSVLVVSIVAGVIGSLIFLPYIFEF
ncbi:MAG: hypothetical protein US86_C0001G0217 [Candidatus Daviesbacteria bacterium GW2011_GWA2_38_24]|uniref:Diacylglycerol kinase n=1 Tax=Candidatus Daviesbacteria bacterium GW2011_GWA2_38_24 TaxID=1618422 RepID=A0A0G0JVZ0_9BACT|nr:MAG: hypothetical protein US86_C0001G0217 [Candidatus Daviesbacteria bacterium GW2011_GWA2_38_24]OGE23550.1 MAG: hypothetical protein A2688_00730 [Candidatus Daviesbacteria bacterium RIFCSPHIGHO2_01_FULL_38_8]